MDYTEGLEQRIEQLEELNYKYSNVITKLDSIKDLHLSYTSCIDHIITIEGVLGYMQSKLKVIDKKITARYVMVTYEIKRGKDHYIQVIHHTKKNGDEGKQLKECVHAFKQLWRHNLDNKFKLIVGIIDAELEYDKDFFGRI